MSAAKTPQLIRLEVMMISQCPEAAESAPGFALFTGYPAWAPAETAPEPRRLSRRGVDPRGRDALECPEHGHEMGGSGWGGRGDAVWLELLGEPE
jgi:hypothetical protein